MFISSLVIDICVVNAKSDTSNCWNHQRSRIVKKEEKVESKLLTIVLFNQMDWLQILLPITKDRDNIELPKVCINTFLDLRMRL